MIVCPLSVSVLAGVSGSYSCGRFEQKMSDMFYLWARAVILWRFVIFLSCFTCYDENFHSRSAMEEHHVFHECPKIKYSRSRDDSNYQVLIRDKDSTLNQGLLFGGINAHPTCE